MTHTNYLGLAFTIASTVHENQRDLGGNAYITHPVRIMMRLRTTDEELMQMAILHDAIEDSFGKVTIQSLIDQGFSKRVTDGLSLLTHNKDDDYETYIMKIASNMDAIRVKLEDLRDNSDITRLKGLREKDFERMKKYSKAYTVLKNTLENYKAVGYTK